MTGRPILSLRATVTRKVKKSKERSSEPTEIVPQPKPESVTERLAHMCQTTPDKPQDTSPDASRVWLVTPFPKGGGQSGQWGSSFVCKGPRQLRSIMFDLLSHQPAYSEIKMEEVTEEGEPLS